LSDFVFYFLAVSERCIAARVLDFGMVNKEVFAAIVWGDETITFVCIEPLYCTCTHAVFSFVKLIEMNLLCSEVFTDLINNSAHHS